MHLCYEFAVLLHLKTIIWTGLAFLLIGCCASDVSAQHTSSAPVKQHQTALGFTPWPADLNETGVNRTYAFVAQHSNLIAHHFDGGVPWDAALSDTRYPANLMENWNFRKSKTPPDFKVFLALTPLDFGRTGIALDWNEEGENQSLSKRWRSKSINHENVKAAYLSYVRRAVEFFEPDYLAIGIEANLIISKSPDLWSEYLALNAHVYRGIKQRHPNLPVFATIQYEHLRGIESEAKRNRGLQIPAVTELMENSDFLALSTYRFGQYHPNPMGPSYFEIAERFGKPIAIAESGAMSSPVNIFGTQLAASEVDQTQFVSGLLAHAVQKNFSFVVNWVAIDFDPMIKKLPKPMNEVAKAWVHSGLQTASGKNKPAFEVWKRYLHASSPEGVLIGQDP